MHCESLSDGCSSFSNVLCSVCNIRNKGVVCVYELDMEQRDDRSIFTDHECTENIYKPKLSNIQVTETKSS